MMWAKKRLAQVIPVRPVARTGQTGPARLTGGVLVLCFVV